jgi:hypothetical protein
VLTSLSMLGLAQKPNVVWGIHHSLASPKDESISTKIALGLSNMWTHINMKLVHTMNCFFICMMSYHCGQSCRFNVLVWAIRL